MAAPLPALASAMARAAGSPREVPLSEPATTRSPRLLFSQAVLDNRAALFGYLRRLGASPETAEDCLQEALVRAYDRMVADPRCPGPDLPPDLEDAERTRAYLYGVARHVFLDEARRRAVRERPLPEEPLAVAANPERDFGERETRAMLRTAVAALEPPRPEILELFYGAGLGVADIAGIVGIPEGTVKTHLHRARADLRRLLGGRGPEEG